jgi:methoxymalonate biosynthesis acyl carrier protein
MGIDPQDARLAVRQFFAQYVRDHEFSDDLDVFAAGFLNSLFTMQLVLFVEQRFEIVVEDDDLELDNFRSVDAIVGFVARKATAATAPGG